MATLLDTSFPGADETPISTPFATASGIAAGMRKVGNQAAAAGPSVFSVSYDASNTYPQNHEATIYFGVVGGRDCGPAVRATSDGCYFMNSADGSNIRVYKRAGTFYELGAVAGIAYDAAKRYTLRATGGTPTTLKVYEDGVQIGSDIVDDGETYGACLTTGAAGMAGYDGTFRFSRFVGADLTVGGGGGAMSGDVVVDEPTAAGGAESAAELSGSATTDEPTAAGGAASAAELSGNATVDEPAAGGGMSGTAGTITSEPLTTNNGTLLANTPLNFVAIYDQATGALVVRKTGLSTNAAGVYSFSDSMVVPGTVYRHDYETVDGQRRMPLKAAS